MDQSRDGQDGLRPVIAPLGRRLIGRSAKMTRASGLTLGRTVAQARRPKLLPAATRLVPYSVAREPAGTAAPAAAAAPAESGGEDWTASTTESTVLPGISDWGAEYLFGDAAAAQSDGEPWMGGAGLQPKTPEERRLSRLARGGLEMGRGAKILETGETIRQGTPPPSSPSYPEAPAPPRAPAPAPAAPAASVARSASERPAEAPAPAPAASAPAPARAPAQSVARTPSQPAPAAPRPSSGSPARVALKRQPAPAAPARPAVRRTARSQGQAPAPPAPAEPEPAVETPPPAPAQSRGLLRRMVDSFRSPQPEPPVQSAPEPQPAAARSRRRGTRGRGIHA